MQPAPIYVPEENTDKKYRRLANCIRMLSVDAVKAANSGHSGLPMGMADVATVLFSKFMKFDPKNPLWPDRDRFILSGGHGSMLLYSLGYLLGYEKMTLEEIKNFRQLHSRTPGHPEVDMEVGIETTTGPLGQGISNAPGFALAERILNARFGNDLVNHYTYVFCGDGDLMEGVSHEACSFAGHFKLSKLIVLYDDNGICIDGPTNMTWSENVTKRFEGYGWDVQAVDGHDFAAIEAAIAKAQKTDTPSLIRCKTRIGFGAPTQEGTNSAHGAITKDDEIAGIRKNLDWSYAPFEIPEDLLAEWRAMGEASQERYAAWKKSLGSSAKKPSFERTIANEHSDKITKATALAKHAFATEKPKHATRQTSGMVLEQLVPEIDSMIGGSADLTGSNNTFVKGTSFVTPENYDGRYIHYGVREHGMAAMMNGMALHGGIIPYSGTFLQFADYARPAMRLAALMKQQVIHVMTHDSIGLGEDGPTHQPVEHLAALRAIPNLYLFRPCDGIETAECWELALNKKTAPSVLALSRQGVPTICGNRAENMTSRGAYILKDATGLDPQATLFASGSEVHLALSAAEKLEKDGVRVRVVSVPCMDLFWEQDGEYIQSLICNKSLKVGIEAGIRQGWDRLIGAHNPFIGMHSFGESAPAEDLFKYFGITTDAIVETVKKAL
ncbi:MAG: transketolase [Rhodospirillales bacterium]|nr:transketolase [Rhodospirillales bacterium]